jgi:hypothetical protein
MAQRPSFDMTKLSTADKIILGAGFLYFIDLFLPWNRKCLSILPGAKTCGTALGWHGIGILAGLLIIALLLWEGALAAGVQVNTGTIRKGLVSLVLAGALLLFTLIRVLIKPSVIVFTLSVWIWGWIGLILAVVIAYGGFMRWQQDQVGGAPPASPPGYTP